MKAILLILGTGISWPSFVQAQTDTVVVELTRSSKVILMVSDQKDLPELRQYDYQALFENILNKIENKSSSISDDQAHDTGEPVEVQWEENEEADKKWRSRHARNRSWGDRSSLNIDLGMNNYLSDGNFPVSDPYSVRTWGSWYVGINSIQRSPVSRKFYLEWGLGLSWYNFKFENTNLRLDKDEFGVTFTNDLTPDRHFRKSKLTVGYLQASFVPVIDFKGAGRRARMWDGDGRGFRIGIGPYGAYRLGSYNKVVYTEGGNRQKERNRDSFYLENFRYGIRLQVGIRSTDLFFNYDLNPLFTETPANPRLNAFSFGIIF
jgi:hypothetical protein